MDDTLHIVYPKAAGIDIHKMAITVSTRIVDGAGAPQTETREFSALPSGITEMVAWLQAQHIEAALMEGTGIYWEVPFDALATAGIRPILVHAQQVKQIKGRKTDVADSIWLARLCQFGLAMASFVPDRTFRNLRSLCRARRKEIAEQSRIRTRTQKIIDRTGVRVGGILTDVFGRNGRRILDGLVQGLPAGVILESLSRHVRTKLDRLGDALTLERDDCHRFLLSQLLQRQDEMARHIQNLQDQIVKGLEPWRDQLQILMTIPGMSLTSACDIFVEIGPDLKVFPSPDNLAAWAGLCPGNTESGGKRRSGKTLRGNKHLKTALVECAHGARRTKGCQFEGYHRSLNLRRGYKKATVATAHKLLRVIYSCLKTQTPYQDPHIDYDKLMVERNAPRWLKMLTEFGFIAKTAPANPAGVQQ